MSPVMEGSLRVPVTGTEGSPLAGLGTRHERQRQLVLRALGVSRAQGMRATQGAGEERGGDSEAEPYPGSERRERERDRGDDAWTSLLPVGWGPLDFRGRFGEGILSGDLSRPSSGFYEPSESGSASLSDTGGSGSSGCEIVITPESGGLREGPGPGIEPNSLSEEQQGPASGNEGKHQEIWTLNLGSPRETRPREMNVERAIAYIRGLLQHQQHHQQQHQPQNHHQPQHQHHHNQQQHDHQQQQQQDHHQQQHQQHDHHHQQQQGHVHPSSRPRVSLGVAGSAQYRRRSRYGNPESPPTERRELLQGENDTEVGSEEVEEQVGVGRAAVSARYSLILSGVPIPSRCRRRNSIKSMLISKAGATASGAAASPANDGSTAAVSVVRPKCDLTPDGESNRADNFDGPYRPRRSEFVQCHPTAGEKSTQVTHGDGVVTHQKLLTGWLGGPLCESQRKGDGQSMTQGERVGEGERPCESDRVCESGWLIVGEVTGEGKQACEEGERAREGQRSIEGEWVGEVQRLIQDAQRGGERLGEGDWPVSTGESRLLLRQWRRQQQQQKYRQRWLPAMSDSDADVDSAERQWRRQGAVRIRRKRRPGEDRGTRRSGNNNINNNSWDRHRTRADVNCSKVTVCGAIGKCDPAVVVVVDDRSTIPASFPGTRIAEGGSNSVEPVLGSPRPGIELGSAVPAGFNVPPGGIRMRVSHSLSRKIRTFRPERMIFIATV
uniref:Uncharacterized protein LOC116947719 isoform X2 n=1 Tax=Petromyzon marinus TaxID=7757 RepID=A0AAJ7TMN3_PETMA|nr:uncharacterized protein LOC116947719 isoform X2 [Petromyzon marinus]